MCWPSHVAGGTNPHLGVVTVSIPLPKQRDNAVTLSFAINSAKEGKF